MSRLALLVAIFIASFLLTAVLKKLAFRARLIDSPVARSAHTVPTPLGGGQRVNQLGVHETPIF
jgi:UDP-N-acetylmuramyl pentapeptide phosphotransferase/UDP-N-acetylglucosamine-1-phosphate transferase